MDADRPLRIDGGVVYEGVPCVVAVVQVGVADAVGVGVFDTLAFFVGLADPCLKVGVAPGVVLVVGVELVESVLVGVLVLGVGGVGGDELIQPCQYCVTGERHLSELFF